MIWGVVPRPMPRNMQFQHWFRWPEPSWKPPRFNSRQSLTVAVALWIGRPHFGQSKSCSVRPTSVTGKLGFRPRPFGCSLLYLNEILMRHGLPHRAEELDTVINEWNCQEADRIILKVWLSSPVPSRTRKVLLAWCQTVYHSRDWMLFSFVLSYWSGEWEIG